jgi:antitoxin MazE
MGNVTKTCIIRIGKFQVVQIPKTWLEHLNWGEEVEMAVQADQLVIRSPRRPRQGWEEKFRTMHERGDDRTLFSGVGVGSISRNVHRITRVMPCRRP